MKIYFNKKEVTHSDTAIRNNIDNSVPDALHDNMLRSFYGMMQVRLLLNTACNVSSWYRCKKLNDILRSSSPNSAHMQCLAVDFVPNMDLDKAFTCIADSKLEFDQLIIETNSKGSRWLHISFDPKNRREVKRMTVK